MAALVKVKVLPRLAIVYASCGSDNLMQGHEDVPHYRRECNHSDGIDYCREGDSFLGFLIEVYDEPVASRYVFAHDHVTSWHYLIPFWTALHGVMRTAYWRQNSLGGIYRSGWHPKETGPWGADHQERPWAEPLYNIIYANTSMPKPPWDAAFPCCSTFFADEALVRNRKKSEYVQVRQQMRKWVKENLNMPPPGYEHMCSRIFEYTWHMLIGGSGVVPYCTECLG